MIKNKFGLKFIKSEMVLKNNDIFLVHIGSKGYDLGFQVHSWGLRIMLIWYHICLYKKRKNGN